MTAAQLEQCRLSILRYLRESAHYGLTHELLRQYLRAEGRPGLTEDLYSAQLSFLAEGGYITSATHPLNPGAVNYRLTPAGQDFLASLGI